MIPAMVRERRELRARVTSLQERMEEVGEELKVGSFIAERAAAGKDEVAIALSESMQYPTASELRGMVDQLSAARERIRVIDERLNDDSGI